MEGILSWFKPSKATLPWGHSLEKCIYSHTCSWFILAAGILSLFWLFYFLPSAGVQKGKTAISRKTLMDKLSRLVWGASDHDAAANVGSEVIVSKILIHPIKSCKGINVEKVRYTPLGLENDRLWCIIDATKLRVLTAREVSKMVLITTSFEGENELRVAFPEDSGCKSFVVPRNPSEEDLKSWTILPTITLWPTHPPVDGYICGYTVSPSVSVSEVLSQYFGFSVHLVFKGPEARRIDPTSTFPDLEAYAKFQDMYPLLILSEESTAAIEQEMNRHVGQQGIDDQWRDGKIVIERFRPNIVLKGGGPFAEDKWEEISIGSESSPVMTLVSKCTRCLLPNVSPETGERDKAVPFKVLMKFRTGLDPKHKMKPCVGCNAVPAGEGELRLGDRIYIKKRI